MLLILKSYKNYVMDQHSFLLKYLDLSNSTNLLDKAHLFQTDYMTHKDLAVHNAFKGLSLPDFHITKKSGLISGFTGKTNSLGFNYIFYQCITN